MSLTIQNIGKGPALNTVLADAGGQLLEADARDLDLTDTRYEQLWNNIHRLEPMPARGERCYKWRYTGGVGLVYTDALGAAYRTFASKYGTKVTAGHLLPKKTCSS